MLARELGNERDVISQDIEVEMDLRKVPDEEKVNLCRKYTIHVAKCSFKRFM